MPVLKSETRLKEIDTTIAATDASEYAEGDLVYDKGDGLIRHNGSSFEGIQAKFEGMFISTGIKESVVIVNATSTISTDYDCSSSQIFYGTPNSSNWRVNLVNFEIPANSGTNITIIVTQDATPQIPSSLTISSTGTRSTALRAIQWMDGVEPTPTTNGIDVFSFTIFKLSGSEVILGQMVPFGG